MSSYRGAIYANAQPTSKADEKADAARKYNTFCIILKGENDKTKLTYAHLDGILSVQNKSAYAQYNGKGMS